MVRRFDVVTTTIVRQSLPGISVSIGNQHKDPEIQHFRLARLILEQDGCLTAASLGNERQKLFAHLLFGWIQRILCNAVFQPCLDLVSVNEFVAAARAIKEETAREEAACRA